MNKKSADADGGLMQKILQSGTFADKISAMSIAIRNHPKYAIFYLNSLLKFVSAHLKIDAIKKFT